ncbi:hypothetical protein [Microlunatus sp. GCM10028923]|uniref:hypothetical protein n=1 Tax=Microlunatus sp. GCM10028923 TaxID=3273400 RepID=UPI0036125D6A
MSVPTVDDLAADPVSHHYDDLIAPSGLTNLLGTVRVDHDLTQLSAVTFPPVSQGLTATATLFVDGRLFASYGAEVTHAWRPDRVVRSAELPGLRIETTTVAVPGETAVAIDVRVHNLGSEDRTVGLGFTLNARVREADGAWLSAESPSAANETVVRPLRQAQDGASTGSGNDGLDRMIFTQPGGAAVSVQGLDRPATVRASGVAKAPGDAYEVGIGGTARGGTVDTTLDVPAGGSARIAYVQAIGSTEEQAGATFHRVAADVPAAIKAAEEFWNTQLSAAFTPGSGEFSGSLPILTTDNDALRRLYWWGVLGVIWFRRDFAGNVLGRSYDTLMPNYWSTTTFIWDFSLSSLTHALLDPEPMRRQLAHWIASDIHTHFGTSSLTGGPVGQWYSVNDYAMTRLVDDYVRFTGDQQFLAEELAGRPVHDHLRQWAYAWQDFRKASPLADYGEIENLLECVSSYTHEVASLNAANVWNLRTAADLLDRAGQDGDQLRKTADELLPHVIDLYEPGTGFFAARQPDGTRLGVRHCYDFSIVGTTIADDLAPDVKTEMIDFFRRELQTENWIRALSPYDPDASFSVRPDHQWNGAYPAWPADAARALVDLGAPDVALDWLPGLARTANQGPTGQAHFVEEAQPGINGGARKAPPQLPYIIDWSCSSSGAWVALVIESLFGVRVGADGTVTAAPVLAGLDPGAVLHGLRVAGRTYDVHADGRVVSLDQVGAPTAP